MPDNAHNETEGEVKNEIDITSYAQVLLAPYKRLK
jgi:hypothetical protein